MKKFIWLSAALALTLAVPATLPAQQSPKAWSQPFPPFRIAGDVYYVGSRGLAAYLITDPKGHVLIDGTLPGNAAMIAANIRALGFDPRNVRYLLNSHAHFDHSGGLAALKRLTGAQMIASGADRADLESGHVAGRPEIAAAPPVKVDRIVGEGDTIRIGATTMVAHMTPGHTRGCTSWETWTAGRSILFTCSLTVAGEKLTGDPTYPRAAADFRATFAKLRKMKADIFLSFHPDVFAMERKRVRQKAGDADAFVDPGELRRQVDKAERAFEEEYRLQHPRR